MISETGSKLLRNGWKVRFLGIVEGSETLHTTGWVHGVDRGGFNVRFTDGESVAYTWRSEDDFTVLERDKDEPFSHSRVAQALCVERLNRERVEELLNGYSRYTQEDMSKMLSSRFDGLDEAKRDEWTKGWMAAAAEASPSWREQNA